jgi:DNA-binding protein HU-beta
MAKAKFDIKSIELPPVAARPLYAGVGATDLAVEYVRDAVADVQRRVSGVQKNVRELDLEPKTLRTQATTVVSARVDALTKDAKARRAAVETRVAELQADAKAQATKVQTAVNDNVATVTGTVTGTYADLAKRGEDLVARIRKQEATQATVASAKTTSAKAKTTTTQGTKAAKTTAKKATSAAKSATSTAKKSSGPARSSAKATGTSARKTAKKATRAAADGAAKVGD